MATVPDSIQEQQRQQWIRDAYRAGLGGGGGGTMGSMPTNLGPGQRSDAVAQLQQRLAAVGLYTGQIDGIYGPLTQAAVARTNTIGNRGIYGPGAQGGLAALELAAKSSPSSTAYARSPGAGAIEDATAAPVPSSPTPRAPYNNAASFEASVPEATPAPYVNAATVAPGPELVPRRGMAVEQARIYDPGQLNSLSSLFTGRVRPPSPLDIYGTNPSNTPPRSRY